MKIVFAPDSFKGSASAEAAAAALARGWRRVRSADELSLLAMADGGEGTLEAFLFRGSGARRMPIRVTGPSGSRIDTEWLLLPDGTAVIELARTSGITLLDPLAPETTGTAGFGEAIADAIDHGATRLLLAVGGSASSDGGAGALAALGARFSTADGAPPAAGNIGLDDIIRVDLGTIRPLPLHGAVILSDVTNPLLGPRGSAAVFGPQKGADVATVHRMEKRLERFAALVGGDPMAPGGGAAGGTAYGLVAWGATLHSGAHAVAEAIGLAAAIDGADLVVTGEGRFDGQSMAGKVVGEILSMCGHSPHESTGMPSTDVALVAGSIEAATSGFSDAVSLTDLAGDPGGARSRVEFWLEAAGAKLAANAERGSGSSAGSDAR